MMYKKGRLVAMVIIMLMLIPQIKTMTNSL
jgi:hypothetical protein